MKHLWWTHSLHWTPSTPCILRSIKEKIKLYNWVDNMRYWTLSPVDVSVSYAWTMLVSKCWTAAVKVMSLTRSPRLKRTMRKWSQKYLLVRQIIVLDLCWLTLVTFRVKENPQQIISYAFSVKEGNIHCFNASKLNNVHFFFVMLCASKLLMYFLMTKLSVNLFLIHL